MARVLHLLIPLVLSLRDPLISFFFLPLPLFFLPYLHPPPPHPFLPLSLLFYLLPSPLSLPFTLPPIPSPPPILSYYSPFPAFLPPLPPFTPLLFPSLPPPFIFLTSPLPSIPSLPPSLPSSSPPPSPFSSLPSPPPPPLLLLPPLSPSVQKGNLSEMALPHNSFRLVSFDGAITPAHPPLWSVEPSRLTPRRRAFTLPRFAHPASPTPPSKRIVPGSVDPVCLRSRSHFQESSSFVVGLACYAGLAIPYPNHHLSCLKRYPYLFEGCRPH